MREIPEGWAVIPAEIIQNLKTGEVLIFGAPLEEKDTENARHNCDEMGCNSVEHIIYRGPLPYGYHVMPPAEFDHSNIDVYQWRDSLTVDYGLGFSYQLGQGFSVHLSITEGGPVCQLRHEEKLLVCSEVGRTARPVDAFFSMYSGKVEFLKLDLAVRASLSTLAHSVLRVREIEFGDGSSEYWKTTYMSQWARLASNEEAAKSDT